ncbi:glycoside hydrolase family 20 zincin-like fold domain-containing protein, partial [Kibdelosporangium lantanae]
MIPYPNHLVRHPGHFTIPPVLRVTAAPEAQSAVHLLAGYLSPPVHSGDTVGFELDPDIEPEGYELHVTPDRVWLKAATREGFLHGVQTIRQLLLDGSTRL